MQYEFGLKRRKSNYEQRLPVSDLRSRKMYSQLHGTISDHIFILVVATSHYYMYVMETIVLDAYIDNLSLMIR